jgi:hypothetical protein
MRHSLFISAAAAALIAGGAAIAQQQPRHLDGPAAGQGSAPAGKIAPASKAAPAETTGQATEPRSGNVHNRGVGGVSAQEPARKQDKQDQAAGERQSQSPVPPGTSRAQSQDKASPSTTTGQGAAGTSANFTSEQRSKITTVIKQQNVRPVTNVNFSIAIGSIVPRDLHLYPLPAAVIEIYPAWRGYEFVLVGDEIVVIDPATLRIVGVIEA